MGREGEGEEGEGRHSNSDSDSDSARDEERRRAGEERDGALNRIKGRMNSLAIPLGKLRCGTTLRSIPRDTSHGCSCV